MNDVLSCLPSIICRCIGSLAEGIVTRSFSLHGCSDPLLLTFLNRCLISSRPINVIRAKIAEVVDSWKNVRRSMKLCVGFEIAIPAHDRSGATY